MTALDTNVIIGIMVKSSSLHEESTRGIANLSDELCTTPTNIGETLRILTHPKVFALPLKIGKAISALSDLLESYNIRILDEDTNWWRSLSEIEKQIPGLKGNEIFDARIAVCLQQHNIKRIFTFDSDFKKYSFLQVIRPLEG
ncbi:MAG: type II toxin-antitoxin system VapC family toxin [Bdellovibrionales bacterium]|nr:type II toxin-antitoxin system VapC family toxin [Bdellovibrionales bacterium]